MNMIDKILLGADEMGDATRVIIGFTVAILVFVSFLYMADYVNKTAEETSFYCNAHPEVEMWESEHETANCTAWRDGTVVAI